MGTGLPVLIHCLGLSNEYFVRLELVEQVSIYLRSPGFSYFDGHFSRIAFEAVVGRIAKRTFSSAIV